MTKTWESLRRTLGAVGVAGAVLQIAACGVDVGGGVVATGTTLCQNYFEVCINPIFNMNIRRSDGDIIACASGGCHEVGAGFGGSFKIYPTPATATEIQANFVVSRAFANLVSPPDSKLLLEPLAGAGGITGSHTGGDIFPGTSDACYAMILNWISNQVSDPLGPSCGSLCAAPPATCGYP
jgi:hypothetical protein